MAIIPSYLITNSEKHTTHWVLNIIHFTCMAATWPLVSGGIIFWNLIHNYSDFHCLFQTQDCRSIEDTASIYKVDRQRQLI